MQLASTFTSSSSSSSSSSSFALPSLAELSWMARQLSFGVPAGLAMGGVHMALGGPPRRPTRAAIATLRDSWVQLMRDDVKDARDGIYPEALLRLPTSTLLSALPALLGELPRVARRARARDHRVDDAPHGDDDSPVALPDYYRRAFHWQTDGWLSERSARLYEPSVELLFMGAADCMRRRALRPIDDAIADIARPRLFDVACGSGGFLAQLGRAFPRAHLGGCDLSKSYVGRARQRLAHDGIDADVVVENAEALPLKNDLVDVVSCVFLFHELPREVRRRVAAEMFRVLKPGGTVVVVDAAQQHAAPSLAALLDTFPATYHEPYFRSYQHDPLEEVLGDVGFAITQTQAAFLSRVVVGVKPAASSSPSG